MSATIDGYARIGGTRITVYDVLTYAEAGWQASSIAATLGISTAQVQSALDYLAENRDEVLRNYRSILARIERGNSPEIEAKHAHSHDLLAAKLGEMQRRRAGA